MNKTTKTVEVQNKKAYHDYTVIDTLECGIELRGNEVKSIRCGMCNIKDSWCRVQNGELVLRGMYITKYSTANMFDVDERRERKLLAHKREILNLEGKAQEQGMSLIPLKVYFVNGRCKVLVGLCKGKHDYDKRQVLKERQVKRDIDRELKERH